MSPEQLYDCIVNFNSRVRKRHLVTSARRPNPNPPTGTLPADYLRWAELASDQDVDTFWYYIHTGNWRKAKKLSGLPASTIADLMQAYHEPTPSGSDPNVVYEVCGIPVHRMLYLIQWELPQEHANRVQRYLNRPNAPPYAALPARTRRAFEALARLIGGE